MGKFLVLKRSKPDAKDKKQETIKQSEQLHPKLQVASVICEEDAYSSSEYTVYFTNGQLSKIDPYPAGGYYENRDIANGASSIISDGIMYDLTDISSIHSIAVPSYTSESYKGIGTTGYLEYVLRMRSGLYWNEGEYDLSIACLEKATQLMKYSTLNWPTKDFYRIVNCLNDLGRYKRAIQWADWIEDNISGGKAAALSRAENHIESTAKESFKIRIQSCKKLATDLVEVGDSGACCSICAKYRKRVYSLTGKDKRFPQFPADFHFGCGISAWPYIYGVSEPSFACENVIDYSNRPFADDRSKEEIASYKNWMETIAKPPEVIKTPNLTKIIYNRLKQILPDDCPKSLSGFSRMRNANSKNYQALVKKAEAAGFVFPQTLDCVEAWEETE